MNTIFNPSDYENIRKRIENIKPDAVRQWGKMSSSQMIAHIGEGMKVAVGDMHIKRTFMGYVLGPLFKKSFLNAEPFRPNSPTAKELIIADDRNFENEKSTALVLLKRLHEGGEAKVTRQSHAFFGELSPAQWGISQWKHLDHHLRQFGA